jgi:hypothetical protein
MIFNCLPYLNVISRYSAVYHTSILSQDIQLFTIPRYYLRIFNCLPYLDIISGYSTAPIPQYYLRILNCFPYLDIISGYSTVYHTSILSHDIQLFTIPQYYLMIFNCLPYLDTSILSQDIQLFTIPQYYLKIFNCLPYLNIISGYSTFVKPSYIDHLNLTFFMNYMKGLWWQVTLLPHPPPNQHLRK